jgi:hypothetical protein
MKRLFHWIKYVVTIAALVGLLLWLMWITRDV